ncbi:hypothetical protein V491_08127 [Pseudogymnoascus sp. VKM F-3775]|nr:hypothetical protein V491_08127 [Pseudogymnoascus sp. VKM F-3775]
MPSTSGDKSKMGQPDRAPSAVQNAGSTQKLTSTSRTKPRAGQQVCQNYIRGISCYKRSNCRYFHNEQARIDWSRQNRKKPAVGAHKASQMSDTAKSAPSSLTVPSESRIVCPKQTVTDPTVSQTASTSDTSPSMGSTATTPLTDYFLPHLRNKSNSSSIASQSSSIDSAAVKLGFNEWNHQRAEIAASLTPCIVQSTTIVGQDHLDGVLKYKTDILTSNSGIVPLCGQHAKLTASTKESAVASTSKLPASMSNNIDRAAKGIAATGGILPFGVGAREKPDGITDEMWMFMKEREVKNLSISTISSESSRASRKSLDITSKVMSFIHRRINTADAPAPLGLGHPAYDGVSEKPRVCLPNFGNRQTSSKKSRSPLGHVQPAIGLGIIQETPLSKLPNATTSDPAILKPQNPPPVAVRDNSANINAWLDAARFIAADDKAIEEADAIRAKEASSQTRIGIVSKFLPRSAMAMNSCYGEALSETKLFSLPTTLVSSNELMEDSHTAAATKKRIKLVNSLNGIPQSKTENAKFDSGSQVTNESITVGQTATAKSSFMKAELCINYVRGFPCYYGSECDRYHDEELRNDTMMHPCIEYNSGQLCHNRKFCTLFHDVATHNKNRKEILAKKAGPVNSGLSVGPANAPRCLEFALGHDCPRMHKCTLYHDTVFRNATRFANDVCFNFLLGLPCHAEMCKYRHDADLRDTLNGVRSHRSMSFMDGARSNKTEVSSGDDHKLPQERPSTLSPVDATIPTGTGTVVPLCFNYILGMRCTAGPGNCKFLHDNALCAKVPKNTCRQFTLGFPCLTDGGCKFTHDVKLRNMLRESRIRQFSAQNALKADTKGHLSHGTKKGVQETKKSTNLNEKKVVPRSTSIKPPSPAKSEGAAAWGGFAAHIAAEDAAVATRALTNSSGRSQASLITVFRGRAVETDDSKTPKVKDAAKITVRPGKKSGPTSRVVSIASREVLSTKPIAAKAVNESGNSNNSAPVVNDAQRNKKLTRYCPRFHGERYHCDNGDKCDYVHDPKLQKIYKAKDPRFQNTKPPRGAKTSQWAKNSYDCGAWSLSVVPMVPPTKAKGKFARFPLLPAEIRLRIWEFCLALPYSPIVRQRFKNERSTKPTAKYVCFSPLPPLLETCHESRVEALKYFSLCLGTVTSPPRTYINYKYTFVYLCTRRSGYFIPMMQSLLPVDLANIQCLTLKLRDWLINDDCVFRDAIWKFTNLRHLFMLISSRDEDEEFRTPVAEDVLMSVLAWQADELNPEFRMPEIAIMVLPGLEIDSDPEEYAPPATRGERIAEYFHEREIQALFSSAV